MSFDDIQFPVAISQGSATGPQFSTEVTEVASGFEKRNRNWSGARLRINVAPGVRDFTDYETLLKFFYGRAGKARGFRFKDWSDYKSSWGAAAVSHTDQQVGTGNASNQFFQLAKSYVSGPVTHVRKITRPVAGTVKVGLGGVNQASGWTVDTTTGLITFSTPPGNGIVVTAGFEFDVPARFDIDQLEASFPLRDLMQLPEIPIVEIRE